MNEITLEEAAAQAERTLPWDRPGILVGVDGSRDSLLALRFAVDVAPKLDLPVHALVVWDPLLSLKDDYLSDDELARRRAQWQPPTPVFDRGWLQIYRRNVGPLSQGAVLVRETK